MENEGSIAPKERVNIVYKSDNNGVEENIELPLKVLVTGEFVSKENNHPIENRKKISINKDNFNDVMAGQELNLDFIVVNKLSTNNENEYIPVKLSFNNIKDFEPDSILNSVPQLVKLIELREALKALKGPLGNMPEFRKKIDSLIEDNNVKNKLLEELEEKDQL